MAAASKSKYKSLEKHQSKEPEVIKIYHCCRCNKEFTEQRNNFAVSHSPMYRGSGYIPVCNNCIDYMYEEYLKEFGEHEKAMRRMCMKLDLYWSKDVLEMALKTAGSRSKVRTYIGKLNLLGNIDKTYDDTLHEERHRDSEAAILLSKAIADEEQAAIPQEWIDSWGAGHKYEFYAELERRYKEWTADVADLDPAARSIYRQICIQEVQINRAVASGRDADKNINTLNNLLGSANLKPAQKKDPLTDAAANTPFGVWVRRWEEEQPIPEPDPEFQDVDGIVKYISIWFFGHMCKLLGIKNAYCKMYEDEIAKRRVERPDLEDEDDETVFNVVFNKEDDEEDGE